MSGQDHVERGRETRQHGAGLCSQHSIYTQNYTDKHRVTIAVRSWQHGEGGGGRNRLQVGVSLKKIQALSKTGVPGVGRTWSVSTQEESDEKLFGKARTVRVEGEGRSRGRGAVWQLGEGTALPLLGSLQPLRSGRRGAACNPPQAGAGLPDAPGRGWRGLTRACPPGR